VLEPVEAHILLTTAALPTALCVLVAFLPLLPAYTLIVLLGWIALALLYHGYRLHRKRKSIGNRA
jgi:Flp pilus assembly protein TadB